MNESSYLNPETMKSQCEKASNNLTRDNEKLDIVEQYFQDFVNNSNLESKAFTALKQQISDYKVVIQNMKSANDFDIYDFNTLKSSVGDKILNGSEIIRMKNSSYKEYSTYADKANEYDKHSSESFWPWEKLYNSYKSNDYKNLSDQEYKIYKKCCNLEDAYDQIENNTMNLFSDSSQLRSTVDAALSDLASSFHDGAYHPNMNASWRSSFTQVYTNLIMKTNDDRTVSPKWNVIEKIMSRNANDISDEEYKTLSFLYLNMNNDDMSKFLGYCMKGEDVEISLSNKIFGTTLGSEDYSKWTVDKDKVNNIMKYVSSTSDQTLFLMKNIDEKDNYDLYNSLQKQRNIIIQRYSLLNTVKEVGEFHGDYQGNQPTIKIEQEKDNSLVLNFKEYRNIGTTDSPTFSNLGDSKVTISDTCNGPTNTFESVQISETEFYAHFGDVKEMEKTAKFAGGQVKDKVIEKGAKGLGDYVKSKTEGKVLSKAVGYIPFVGDVIEFGTDLAKDEQEAKENNEFIKGQFDSLKSADIYRDFDCSTSSVTYDTLGRTGNKSKKVSLYAYEGGNTQKIVDNVNKNMNTDFDVQDIINNPNGTFNKKKELFDKDPDNDDLYGHSIKVN